MIIKGLTDEDFVNYKKPSMFIAFPKCSFKCGRAVCQNSALVQEPNIEIDKKIIVQRYMSNSITKAIVFGGLEPFDSFVDLLELFKEFRKHTQDKIVIYSGYTEIEIYEFVELLKENFNNFIIKYGRFIPNQEKHFDEILGVDLASSNQHAKEYN